MLKIWFLKNWLGSLIVLGIILLVGFGAVASINAMVTPEYHDYVVSAENSKEVQADYSDEYLVGDGYAYFVRSVDEMAVVKVVVDGQAKFFAVTDVVETVLPGMPQTYLGQIQTVRGNEYSFSVPVKVFTTDVHTMMVVDKTWHFWHLISFIVFLCADYVLVLALIDTTKTSIENARDEYEDLQARKEAEEYIAKKKAKKKVVANGKK